MWIRHMVMGKLKAALLTEVEPRAMKVYIVVKE
jgi:hypothetical protein